MKVIVTGRPGSGKSTVIETVADSLRRAGWRIGGVISPEVNSGGERVGFAIVDIMNGRKGCLASTAPSNGPRFGRYYVNMKDIEEVGVTAIRNALAESDLTVIDEIGPMELKSPAFELCTREAFSKERNILASIHWTMADHFYPSRHASIFRVTFENRGCLPEKIEKLFTGGNS